jgi:hypothetical protein
MKANSLLLLGVLVVACGALLPEMKVAPHQTVMAGVAQISTNETQEIAPSASPTSPAKSESAPKPALSARTKFSAGIADVLKMVEGGVDPAVVEAYIQNSNIAYYPSAEEILQLHQAGISSKIITALIRRGTELRAQQAQAYREMQERLPQPRVSTVANVGEPSTSYLPAVQPVVQPVNYNYYTYPNYAYPSYWNGGYSAFSYGWTFPFYSTFYYRSVAPLRSPLRHPHLGSPRYPIDRGPSFVASPRPNFRGGAPSRPAFAQPRPVASPGRGGASRRH